MKSTLSTLVVLALVASAGSVAHAQPASQPPPVAATEPARPTTSPSQPSGSLAPAAAAEGTAVPWWYSVRPEPAGPGKTIVTTIGAVVAGLGAATMFAASVTWLNAWTESRTMDDECTRGYCVEGTRGGDAYESTRDLAKATDILLATGLPLIGGGLSMVILGAAMGDDKGSGHGRVTVRPTGAGASMEVTF